MPTTCQCPACSRYLRAPDHLLGSEVECPECRNVFVARAATAFGGIPKQPPAGGEHGIQESGRPSPLQAQLPRPFERPAPDDDIDDYRYVERVTLTELPGKGKTLAAIIMLACDTMLNTLMVFYNITELNRAERIVAGNLTGPDALAALGLLMGLLQTVVYLVTVVVYCIWIYRTYKNLQEFHLRGLRYSAGWAVGSYFVPILNLFRPYQIMQEMWKASDPSVAPNDREGWRHCAGSSLIGLWWACSLIGDIVLYISFRLSLNANPTVENFRAAVILSLIGGPLHILAAICLMAIIWQLRRRQEEKFALLKEGSATADGW